MSPLLLNDTKQNEKSQPVASKLKRSKVQKLARRWSWLKRLGGYVQCIAILELGASKVADGTVEGVETRLNACHRSWYRERRAEALRWRGVGCGQRSVCPYCGSYRQLVLAREATEAMLLAQTGVEVGEGVELESYGQKDILTIPKSLSKSIDELLWTDYQAWLASVNKLYRLGYAYIEQFYGKGCGGVESLDFAGESEPCEAHYHLNIYTFPVRRDGKGWVKINHWQEPEELDKRRAYWAVTLNREFGLDLSEVNLRTSYIGKKGMLHHWLDYLYRHSLADLWRGWQGVEDGKVQYKQGRGGKVLELSGEDMRKLTDRLSLIPAHFKRIRWFGIFSDGQRSKTMASLGLEAEEVKDKDDGEDKGWVRDGESAQFVRYAPDGVVLAPHLRNEAGELLWDMIEREDGSFYWKPRLGEEFLVPNKQVCYAPSGVSIGKRKRWREPGGG